MIERHNGCIGLKLLRFGRKQWTLWFAPIHERIEAHTHRQTDVELTMLGGRMRGRIGEREGEVGWWDFLRRFSIPCGTSHSAEVTGLFCLFLTVETWLNGPVTSAAIDFHA